VRGSRGWEGARRTAVASVTVQLEILAGKERFSLASVTTTETTLGELAPEPRCNRALAYAALSRESVSVAERPTERLRQRWKPQARTDTTTTAITATITQ